jgi:putative molybdopterin biosynthesis protein
LPFCRDFQPRRYSHSAPLWRLWSARLRGRRRNRGSGGLTSFSQAYGFLEIDAQTQALDAGTVAKVTLIGAAAQVPDLVIAGSHDVALDVVVGALAERGMSARTIAVGSLGGVAAARRDECDIAPVHLLDPATGRYNQHLTGQGLSLVPGWQRMQGVLFRPGDARFEGRSVQAAVEAAVADQSAVMVSRNAGAGTRILIDQLLAGAAACWLREPAALAQRRRRSHRAR